MGHFDPKINLPYIKLLKESYHRITRAYSIHVCLHLFIISIVITIMMMIIGNNNNKVTPFALSSSLQNLQVSSERGGENGEKQRQWSG